MELEDVEDARILLGRAVECVPHSVDMSWHSHGGDL